MKNNRQRMAWFVLLASFALCIASIAGVPLSIRYFLNNSRAEQDVVMEPQQGTPRMQRRGQGEFIALVGPSWDIPPGTVIITDEATQCLLTLYAPGEDLNAIAAVQIYGDTSFALESARSPRFEMSPLFHEAELIVQAGRVRVNVASADGRNTEVELHTPHLTALLAEGSYEIRVRPTLSEVTVRDGGAQVTSLEGDTTVLAASERTIAQVGEGVLEILSAERNLLANGNFLPPMEESWEFSHDEQQFPSGTVEPVEVAGRPAAQFTRNGIGHAEVRLSQLVDYDVLDFSSLVLHLGVQVQSQSLPGCGSVGSECPIIVRIDYKDVYGTDRVWYTGFFAVNPAETDPLLLWHVQVPLSTWYTFDSGNLMGTFEAPPAVIKEVTIYASGHAFDALVTEVELLAQE